MSALPRPDQIVDAVAHRSVRWLGGSSAAAPLARTALRRRPSGDLLADHACMTVRLDHGDHPAWSDVEPLVSRLLQAADHAVARKRHRQASSLADRALRIAYHPSIHTGPDGSVLMLDQERFLAPFRASNAGKFLLFTPDPDEHRASAQPSEHPGRPLRVLVLSHSSWTFVHRVMDDLSTHENVEFRVVDLSRLPLGVRPTHALAVKARTDFWRHGRLQPVPKQLVDTLTWADTVYLEWGTYPLTWFSMLDLAPFRVRTVARIHRFEMTTPYPLLARSAAFDEIAFVAPHVRTFMETASPRLAQAGRLRTVQNIHSLPARSENQASRDLHELLQVGWAPRVKDVLFTLDVLDELRCTDDRFHLTLIGHDLDRSPVSRSREWTEHVQRRIDAAGDAVTILGYRRDVPDLLGGAGFLVSASRNEGTHESVAEAAAAGCIPIVRDWPENRPWGGAASVYPPHWTVTTPQEAAAQIRLLCDQLGHATEADAREQWVRADRDPTRLRREYMEFLTGSGSH